MAGTVNVDVPVQFNMYRSVSIHAQDQCTRSVPIRAHNPYRSVHTIRNDPCTRSVQDPCTRSVHMIRTDLCAQSVRAIRAHDPCTIRSVPVCTGLYQSVPVCTVADIFLFQCGLSFLNAAQYFKKLTEIILVPLGMSLFSGF